MALLGAEEGSTTDDLSGSLGAQSLSADAISVWAIILSSLLLAVVLSWRFPVEPDDAPVEVAAYGPGRG